MKARMSFGKTTSIETFGKKLLRGVVFADVEAVEQPGLEEMYRLRKERRCIDQYDGWGREPGQHHRRASPTTTE